MDLTKDSVGGKLQWPRGVAIPCVATIDLYAYVILDLWGSPPGPGKAAHLERFIECCGFISMPLQAG